VTSLRMNWAQHAAPTSRQKVRNIFKNLIGKHDETRPVGRQESRRISKWILNGF